MAAAKLGVMIARTVEDVFAVLSDVSKVRRWSQSTVDETLITPGPLRVGSRRRAVIRTIGSGTTVNEAEMVELEPNRKMVVEVSRSPVPVRIVIDLLPVNGGTRLDWTASFTPRGALRLAGPFVALFYRIAFQKDLANLKAMMERREL